MTPSPKGRAPGLGVVANRLKRMAIPAALFVLVAVVTAIQPSFPAPANIQDILTQAALLAIVVLQGVRYHYTRGAPAGSLPDGFRFPGAGAIGSIPVNMIAFALLFVGLAGLPHRGSSGRMIFMTSGNPWSADRVGVRSDRVTIACYILCSIMAGIAGLFLVGFVRIVDHWVGRGYESDSIVAVVIGGVALSGGVGTLWGAAAGALILVLLFNIVIILVCRSRRG